MAVSKNLGVGFECEFVEPPADYLQSECPICLHILREPYQVTCCGKSFCRLCIERVKDHSSNKPCPCCNKDDFNDFPNLGLQQPLYGFKVYCINKEDSCDWTGELGKLDDHLNLNPTHEDKELEGCEFAEIECSYCSDFIKRNKFLHHKNELCDKRPFSCEHCNEYESTYDDVIHNHWPVCGCYPVQCPNKCGAFPERQKLDDHVGKECPLTVVECDFHYAGCEIKLPRRNMPDHLKDGLVAHFSLLAVSHKRQQEEIQAYQNAIKIQQEEIKALERSQKEIRTIKEEVNKLKKQTEQLRLNVRMIFPIDFTVENPTKHVSGNQWSSIPFYSHNQGYKLRISFLINQPWIHVNCYLLRGEFDGLLKWPLKAVMKVALVNQQPQGVDYKFNIELKHSKPLGDEVDAVECGYHISCVVSLDSYIHSRCLHIGIISVQFQN